MTAELKLKTLKEYYPDREIQPKETKRFNGIWFDMDGFEYVVLTNEELYYANNNVVVGNLEDSFEEVEMYPHLTVCSNN
jgi:hypothetical protein